MKILLVDDSRTMRNIQKKVLGDLGAVEFSEAGDGLEALTAIASTPEGFNLIMVDWNMPNMDGITLISRIREKDKATPLIMATTEAEKSRVMEALKAGVNNYVIKPFTPEMLLEKVKTTLEKLKAVA
ncbi:MAG: response regulator [Phycisphaerales bacterium]|nr:response regulator [Phycisphaerales bacterium]